MGPAVPEMGFELKLCAVSTVGGFLRAASATECGDGARAARLEESVKSLEEEKRKIEAFKRELPLCMHLLCDVIEGLNKEIERCRSEKSARLFKEFIPAKSKVAEDGGLEAEDKMKWMSSAQLWSVDYCKDNNDIKIPDNITAQEKGGGDHSEPEKENLFLESRRRSSKGAFVPFKGPSAIPVSCKGEAEKTELSLQSPAISNPLSLVKSVNHHGDSCGASKAAAARAPESSPTTAVAAVQLNLQQLSRKARRCWSQELHRRFVLAIQRLGGVELATPKQIREQMKVEGLTNDEVKSHLQKYRMHTRRASSNSSTLSVRPGGDAKDIWNPSEQQHTSPSQQSFSLSSSPQSPCQLAGSAHAVSATAGDSSEEDGKSETYSWR